MDFLIKEASEKDIHHAQTIVDEIADSAKIRGTGIAKRSPAYIIQKITEGKAVIATTSSGEWAGFCYIEAWGHGDYVANSGLIVSTKYRGNGLAKEIKSAVFKLSRSKFPKAKIFGLTTGAAVMKINSSLGYKPVVYGELTDDEAFWKGCQSCVNYEILQAKGHQGCICTAMLFNPEWKEDKKPKRKYWRGRELDKDLKLFQRWTRLKKAILLTKNKTKNRNEK